MKSIFTRTMWGVLAISACFGMISLAHAQTTGGGTVIINSPIGKCNWPCLAQRIIAAMYWIAIPIVSIMVVYGGFQILFAAGDPEKFKVGRKTILYAVVGFLVILIGLGVDKLLESIFKK